MAIGNLNVGSYKVLTATGNVASGEGALLGLFCSTTSSGTIILYDSATTTTTIPITAIITLTAGTWYNIPVTFTAGLYAVIANTANVTISSVS